MINSLKVTVLTTAYNPGRYLEAMVQSVLLQTFSDWELVVVDDESPEDISYIIGIDPRIRLQRRKNGGAYVARNTGILHSAGEYIAFIDQDDLWSPTKLERQVAFMDANPDVGLCHCNTDVIDAEGNYLEPGFARRVDTYEELLLGNGIMNCSCMVRRSVLASSGLFDGYYRGVGDYDLWLRIAKRSRLAFIPTCEASWRSHSGNFSGQAEVMHRELEYLYRAHLLQAQEQRNQQACAAIIQGRRAMRVSYGSIYFAGARERLRSGPRKQFYRMYLQALKLQPVFVLKSTLSYLLGKNRAAIRPVNH